MSKMLGEFVWVCWEECFKRLQNHYIPGISRRLGEGLGLLSSLSFYRGRVCSGERMSSIIWHHGVMPARYCLGSNTAGTDDTILP